jgi:hypothetical protein
LEVGKAGLVYRKTEMVKDSRERSEFPMWEKAMKSLFIVFKVK